jgi:acyl dehydratase
VSASVERRELSSSPSMGALYPKAAAGGALAALRRLPGAGALPGVGEPARELPEEELVLAGVEVDREHLAAYDRVCTFEIRDELPATYPHVLAFPLAMKLMTAGSFPFPVIGLVHAGNRIEHGRPIRADERLTLSVRAEDLRPHDRGAQFDIVAEAQAGGEVVWRSSSNYLRREGGGSSGGKGARQEPPEPSSEWSVPGDTGRRYAAVSGDRNPIHLHPLSARLFGFPRPIAHGMWLKARCLAVLDSLLPDAFDVEVAFKLPVFLPGRVALSTSLEGGSHEFALHDAKSGKPHMSGTVRRRGVA